MTADPCDCITKINADLKDRGAALSTTLFGNPLRAMIPLVRTDKWITENRRGKPSMMLASYCPWCGQKYQDGRAIAAAEKD